MQATTQSHSQPPFPTLQHHSQAATASGRCGFRPRLKHLPLGLMGCSTTVSGLPTTSCRARINVLVLAGIPYTSLGQNYQPGVGASQRAQACDTNRIRSDSESSASSILKMSHFDP